MPPSMVRPPTRVWLYVHGKGGCKEEAADFAALACPRGWQVLAADLPEHGHAAGTGCPWTPARSARAAGAVGLCQRAVAAYRPAVHQSGGLVLPAGLRRGASGAGAFRLPGGGHGGAHPRHDGVGRASARPNWRRPASWTLPSGRPSPGPTSSMSAPIRCPAGPLPPPCCTPPGTPCSAGRR